MTQNFFEIDFMHVGENGSGDAIAIRYNIDGKEVIHIVDGGYKDDGQNLCDHIKEHYNNPEIIDHVVLTHPDQDHGNGLVTVLEKFKIGHLWLNRPWQHLDGLLPLFNYDYTEIGLRQRLRKNFPTTASLEDKAEELGIPIMDAFAGDYIGEFKIVAPSYNRYLDLIVESEKTPEPARKALIEESNGLWEKTKKAVSNLIETIWGGENLKGGEGATSRENEASIVQSAELFGKKILLTGDAGVEALQEAYDNLIADGVNLPGIDNFQVPHHGSRRNVSSEILDAFLGPKLSSQSSEQKFSAIVSANKNDSDHPKKATVRAMIHRGGKVFQTNGCAFRTSHNAPERDGWSSATPASYPSVQEE